MEHGASPRKRACFEFPVTVLASAMIINLLDKFQKLKLPSSKKHSLCSIKTGMVAFQGQSLVSSK